MLYLGEGGIKLELDSEQRDMDQLQGGVKIRGSFCSNSDRCDVD